jgi:hypothetical protein
LQRHHEHDPEADPDKREKRKSEERAQNALPRAEIDKAQNCLLKIDRHGRSYGVIIRYDTMATKSIAQ